MALGSPRAALGPPLNPRCREASEGSALPRGLKGEWMFARKRMGLPLGARCVPLLQAWPAPDPLLFVPAALRAHMLERFTEWCLAQLDLSWRVALLHSLLPSELAAALKKKKDCLQRLDAVSHL